MRTLPASRNLSIRQASNLLRPFSPILISRFPLLLLLLTIGLPLTAQTGSEGSPIPRIRRELAEAHSLSSRSDRLAEARRIEGEIRILIEAAPDDPDLLWWAIAAMGVQVDNESNRGKIERTRKIYDETKRLRALAPDHPGGEHAMGRLHAGVMRLNAILRFLAVRLIGGDLLREASWEEAEAHLRRAMALDPDGLHHRYELAVLLVDRDRYEEAHSLLRSVAEGRSGDRGKEDELDNFHRERITELLAFLRER